MAAIILPPMDELMKELLVLIGREAVTDGVRCRIIDILPHATAPRVVLRECGAADEIQPDQYGDPRRRVPRTHTIAARGEGGGLHPVLLPFVDDAEKARLAAVLTVS